MSNFSINGNANPGVGDIVVNANAGVAPAPAPAPAAEEQPAAPAAPAPAPKPQQTSIYGKISEIPVLDAVEGIKFDFNNGIRILFPKNNKIYRVVFSDIDTGIILYSADSVPGAYITSVKKFYIRFRLEIYNKGEEKPIFTHDYDAKGREVMIQLPVGTIGDSIGWFSYVERFQQKHQCKVICVMMPWISLLVRDQYPDITFIGADETEKYRPYACYFMGLFFKGDVDNQPIDFRYIGLHRTAGYILGVDPADIPPRFNLSAPRRIKEKYVCIAAQSSSQAKYWNNPYGWRGVIKFLKDNGYRVICIDKESVHGFGLVWNQIPWGAEDFTGARSLQERVDLVKDADFFIGLSSGLSWLAWGCRVPVVMISGFTHPTNEFATPYRVINYHTCHSCWNDMRVDFDHYDFLWCPRQKGTDRQFECSRLISVDQVIHTIKKVPTFQPGEPIEHPMDAEAFAALGKAMDEKSGKDNKKK
ncbi:MAG: autotransporter strand-loop-strand O-heptosyltransferase [Victivallaceae bacterium]|nr:autotransporter strand-loop-strand O-heptosyltransferase [Victivallaceae bacterium]